MSFLVVACGGFLGAITRFSLSQIMNKTILGTWIANITGSILLAFVIQWYWADQFSYFLWLFLGVGFCGAYTTFSTFGVETLDLLLNKKYLIAFLYVSSSLLVSIFFVWLILL